MSLAYTHIGSPIGQLLLAGDGAALHYLSFPGGHKAFGPRPDWRPDPAPFAEVRRQLEAYFAGALRDFDLKLHLTGTPFQIRVWNRLAEIPYGKTVTYGRIATDLGDPGASRAVGAANGNNPIPIILPCHRVIGANGALTGFGGGLPTKEWLLKHEGVLPGSPVQLSLFG